MNSIKVYFALAFIGFCCLLGAQSLRCYTCNGVSNCKSPAKYDCSSKLANDTRSYLNTFYKGVNLNQTSTSYKCLSDYLYFNTTKSEQEYKGCVYSNMGACALALNDYYAGTNPSRKCYDCTSDYCNPAGRAGTSSLILLGSVTILAALKHFMH